MNVFKGMLLGTLRDGGEGRDGCYRNAIRVTRTRRSGHPGAPSRASARPGVPVEGLRAHRAPHESPKVRACGFGLVEPGFVSRAVEPCQWHIQPERERFECRQRAGVIGAAEDLHPRGQAPAQLVEVLVERVRTSFLAEFTVHEPVDGAALPGTLRGPVPTAFGIGVVGEPGQREQLDFLVLRAVRQLLQRAESLLLCRGHAAVAFRPVPLRHSPTNGPHISSIAATRSGWAMQNRPARVAP